jgi:hypothetical protein
VLELYFLGRREYIKKTLLLIEKSKGETRQNQTTLQFMRTYIKFATSNLQVYGIAKLSTQHKAFEV